MSLYMSLESTAVSKSALSLTDDELAHHITDAHPRTIKNVRCKYSTTGELVWDGTTRALRTGRLVKVFRYTGNIMKDWGKNDLVSNKAKTKNEKRVDKSDDIREAIGGLLSIIRLIETQLQRFTKKRT
jgi:hypothetical protein